MDADKLRISTRRALLTVLCCLGISVTVSAQPRIVVSLNSADSPYGDCHLAQKLDYNLAVISAIAITRIDSDQICSSDSDKEDGLKALLEYGQAHEARFIVDIRIDRINLVKKKKTIFPILVYRYKTFAVLAGKMRIIDVGTGGVVSSEKIEYDIKASDQWQVTEDDPDNPSLMIPSDQKILLFDNLEEMAAADITARVKNFVSGSDFD